MPQVPTYQGPQVSSQPLRPAYQNDVDVSSGTKALARGLDQVADAADRIVERDAIVKAETVDTEISTGWLEWSSKNQRNYQGENAKNYEPDAKAWWASAKETYGKDLDPRAKAIITRTLARKQGAAMGNVAQFVGTEQERHADDVNAASVASAVQFGVSTGDVAGSAEQLRSMAAAKGARKGWTTEQVQAEQLKNLSGLHLAQITKLAEKNPEAAQEYYVANKLEIAAAAQPRMEEVIKGETDNKFATQFAAQHADKPLSEQLKAAGDIQDPTRREKTLNQMRNNFALVKQAQAEREQAVSDQAWQMVGQGKRVPETILAGMDGKERVQLQEHLRARAERLATAGNKPVKTNPTELAKVYDMMRDDPEGFKKLRMQSLTNSFSPTDIEQVSRIQRDMLKPDKEKDVATTAQLMGVYTGGWKPEKRSQFEAAAYDELNRFEKEKGKPPGYEEKKKILDRLMLDGEVLSGAWYKNDADKKFYEATPAERKNFAPTISGDDRNLVKSALQAEGIKNPTDAQITERFRLAKGIK